MVHYLTMYSENAHSLLTVLDFLAVKKGMIKVIATDPERLYNDANHSDVSMYSITFICNEDRQEIKDLINDNNVFICTEDPNDWQ